MRGERTARNLRMRVIMFTMAAVCVYLVAAEVVVNMRSCVARFLVTGRSFAGLRVGWVIGPKLQDAVALQCH